MARWYMNQVSVSPVECASPSVGHRVDESRVSARAYGAAMPEISRFYGIRAWATLHRGELLRDWELARSSQPLDPIAPLD